MDKRRGKCYKKGMTTTKARRTSTANRHGSKWIRPAKRQAIYDRDGHCCVYCERSIYTDVVMLTLDHVTPRSVGGDNAHTNLVTACRSCNSARRDLPVGAFALTLADQGVDPKSVARRVRNSLRRNVTYNGRTLRGI